MQLIELLSTSIHTCLFINTYIYIYTHVYIYVSCIYIHNLYIYLCMCENLYVNMYMYIYVHLCNYKQVFVFIFVSINLSITIRFLICSIYQWTLNLRCSLIHLSFVFFSVIIFTIQKKLICINTCRYIYLYKYKYLNSIFVSIIISL
jgi:hypothetical protein